MKRKAERSAVNPLCLGEIRMKFNVTIAFTCVILGGVAGGVLVKKIWLEKYRAQKAELSAAERQRDMDYTWLLLKQRGVELRDYFAAQGCQRVAVLGMNREGCLLVEELGELASYGVETENLGAVHQTLTVYRLGDDPLPPADCMVICDLERVPEKTAAAKREFPGPVVTLTAVLAELLEQRGIERRDGAVPGWPPAG